MKINVDLSSTPSAPANTLPAEFIDREYPIPDDLLKGKDQVTVRFQPVGQSQAGRVFGCYVMREQ